MSFWFSENAKFTQIVDWQWEYRCVWSLPHPQPGGQDSVAPVKAITGTQDIVSSSLFSNPGSDVSGDCPTIREPRVPNFLFINRFKS